jgi:hypothetical protein
MAKCTTIIGQAAEEHAEDKKQPAAHAELRQHADTLGHRPVRRRQTRQRQDRKQKDIQNCEASIGRPSPEPVSLPWPKGEQELQSAKDGKRAEERPIL